MSVLEEGFKEATKSLDFKKRPDRVRGFYVRRRAEKLVKQHPSWDALDLTLQLVGEQSTIMNYLTQKLNALIRGPDPKSPSHLDLKSMSKIKTASGSAATEKTYVTNRADWIWQIVWRAVALHDDLWKSATPPRELAADALDEIVDRRLRAVERMTCNVNSGGLSVSPGSRSWSVAGPNGPWKDGLRVRMFEYPFLPRKPFKAHRAQMPDWTDAGNDMMIYAPAGAAPVRFPARVAASWKAEVTAAGTIWLRFEATQSLTPADVIRKLFEIPREDFLDRSWLYCDMVGSALNIEALWVGKQRRDGNNAAFDAVMRKPSYVYLGPVVRFDGTRDLDILMADGNDDDFFENTEVDFDDLQVGDYVLFWNSRIYSLLTHGAWGNEFSHVMGVDADPASGKISVTGGGPQIFLAGHGLHTRLYQAMAAELADGIADLLDFSRKRIAVVLGGNPTATSVAGGTFVRWAPYEEFDEPGPWWLVVPKTEWRNQWAYASIDEALKAVPRTVAHDPAGGTGYRPPTDIEAIYFPLYEPVVAQTGADGDSWRAYLKKRKADASYRAPSKLAGLKVDGRIAVGLFYRGTQSKIPVVRPRVKL